MLNNLPSPHTRYSNGCTLLRRLSASFANCRSLRHVVRARAASPQRQHLAPILRRAFASVQAARECTRSLGATPALGRGCDGVAGAGVGLRLLGLRRRARICAAPCHFVEVDRQSSDRLVLPAMFFPSRGRRGSKQARQQALPRSRLHPARVSGSDMRRRVGVSRMIRGCVATYLSC